MTIAGYDDGHTIPNETNAARPPATLLCFLWALAPTPRTHTTRAVAGFHYISTINISTLCHRVLSTLRCDIIQLRKAQLDDITAPQYGGISVL